MGTLKDIAQICGVSISTASRALRGHKSISAATRKRVIEAAKELNYNPNHLARTLLTGKSRVIGLLLPHVSNPFFASVAEGVESAANHADYRVILGMTHWNEKGERDYIRWLREMQADGVVILPTTDTSARASLASLNSVVIDKAPDGCNFVRTDNQFGMRLAVNHLVDLGHRRIAVVGNTNDTSKLKGYKGALFEHGISFDSALICSTANIGEQAVQEWVTQKLHMNEPPTAIITFADHLAVRLFVHLQSSGVAVPEQIALVGYDNTYLSELLGITSVAQPQREIGRLAATILIDQIEGRESEIQRVVLPPSLVVRKTSTPFRSI